MVSDEIIGEVRGGDSIEEVVRCALIEEVVGRYEKDMRKARGE